MTPPLAPAREPSPFRSLARWESCCEPGNGESFLRLGTCSAHCVQPACTWMMKPYARPCGASGRNGSNPPSAHDDQPPPTQSEQTYSMLKRLIEVALPLKEDSEQSAREKSIRHGNISTLHIWWARKPLAACRAAVFASLIPDPDDPECPESFRKLVRELLGRREFKPRTDDGSTVEDTPRNRCLEFIKHLVKWENSNNPEYIEPARRLITAAHKFLHPDSESDAPIVLDPFAGGGAIPLESLRLGCETHAIDLNPVAHLIELCTLVYPQRYGKADSRPVPEYIKRLIPLRKREKRAKRQEGGDLFTKVDAPAIADALVPEVEITETEYRNNPLAADVKYWGHWIRGEVQDLLSPFYSTESKTHSPVAYLWARTVKCASPDCKATIPLVSQFWLCKKAGRKIAVRMRHDLASKELTFDVVEGSYIEFDPNSGTVQRGNAECPVCRQVSPASYIRKEFLAGRGGPAVDGCGTYHIRINRQVLSIPESGR